MYYLYVININILMYIKLFIFCNILKIIVMEIFDKLCCLMDNNKKIVVYR